MPRLVGHRGFNVILDDVVQFIPFARPSTGGERLRGRLYFQRSLVRATARWAKYVVTFEDWLEFLLRKARRHSGQEIELTERERRLPLIFLWPRVIGYLRHKDKP